MRVAVDNNNRIGDRLELHRRQYTAHLPEFRCQRTVGHHYSVDAEGSRIRLVAVVATEMIAHSCRRRVPFSGCRAAGRLANGLVDPVPDESSGKSAMGIELIPVVLEVAQGVAHAVGIFGCYDGTVVVLPVSEVDEMLPTGILRPFLTPIALHAEVQIFLLYARIETLHNIDTGRVGVGKMALVSPVGVPDVRSLGTLVGHRTRRVERMKPSCHGPVARAEPALVAQTPEYHRRMVLVALSHALRTFQERCRPVRPCGDGATQTVGLGVRLVHNIDAGRVAEFVPPRTIGVVTRPNGIDIGIFHQSDILLHAALRHHTGSKGVELVAVDATDFYRLTIDKNLSSADFYPSEPHMLLSLTDGATHRVGDSQSEGI